MESTLKTCPFLERIVESRRVSQERPAQDCANDFTVGRLCTTRHKLGQFSEGAVRDRLRGSGLRISHCYHESTKRRRSDSNRCIKVLQTSPLPLGYGARH